MRFTKLLPAMLLVLSGTVSSSAQAGAPGATQAPAPREIKVTLLGTASGPPVRLDRYQMSTLVEAGGERLLFDCGRGTTLRLTQAGLSIADVNKVFITHLHSDHIVDIPDLYLSGWAARSQRKLPFQVWGPAGTHAMMENLQKAFAFDIHIRRDVDEHFSAEGIKAISHDISEGIVYEKNGVKVTAFLVDHGPVKPAFGYRVDYAGHSVAISGDTRPSENLVKYSQGVDVLIHEAIDPDGFRKHPGSLTAAQAQAILNHHSTPEQAGEIFARVKPRLAVYSHYPDDADLLNATRKTYSGPLQVGEDLMTIDIGGAITVGHVAQREQGSAQQAPSRPAVAPPNTASVELSPEQRTRITMIIAEAKENGEITARRLKANAAKYDEALFAETLNDDLENKSVAGIEGAIHDAAETRLQAARQVVHLLTPEQRRYLKGEMAKPDSQGGILEIAEKVFHIRAEKE
jgi:ribonuclease Z